MLHVSFTLLTKGEGNKQAKGVDGVLWGFRQPNIKNIKNTARSLCQKDGNGFVAASHNTIRR